MKRTNNLPRLAMRVFGTPLLLEPQKADIIVRVLAPRIGIDVDDYEPTEEDVSGDHAFSRAGGVAIVPICGTLVKKSSGLSPLSGMMGYDEIQAAITDALTDPQVSAVVLDIDSPGGESSGCFDLSDWIYSQRGTKPIYAVANDGAYSAAYAIASAADKVFVTRTGGVGSVGVYAMHLDQSAYDQKQGLKYTAVFAGDHKMDCNPHEPLSDDARASLQDEVNRQYSIFVGTVARNRGVTAEAVIETQAGVFFAEEALPLFADAVATIEDVVEQLSGKPDDNDEAPAADVSPATVQQMSAPAAGIERRASSAVRLSAGETGDTITALIVPYNSPSVDLGGFREVYEPGCFSESIASDDIRALFNHNADYILGRRSAGTLRVFEDVQGLKIEATVPDTTWARDLLISMRRGDVTQASSAFYILKQRWETRDGMKTRVIEKGRLVEGSVVTFPAYESTTATVDGPRIDSHFTEVLHGLQPASGQQPLPEDWQAKLSVFRKRLELAGR